VKLLLDTHILLWAIASPAKLSPHTVAMLSSSGNELIFSVASLWEIAIKNSSSRFTNLIDVQILRNSLLTHHYRELPIWGGHALCVAHLPQIHRDPFDRILVAQALVEDMRLVTADKIMSRYPGRIHQA